LINFYEGSPPQGPFGARRGNSESFGNIRHWSAAGAPRFGAAANL